LTHSFLILSPERGPRIVFLDWLRGLAAVIMLQGHVFHAFLRPGEREGALFVYSQFFGGQAAALFLFLTGVTYALGMNRREHLPAPLRIAGALRRAGYLFLLAVLFRLQTWAFAWPLSPWTDLLRVDILNAMGVTAALLAALALFHGLRRARLAAAAGVALAVVSPVVSGLDTRWMAEPLRNYVVPGADVFSLFPWGAYLAFGLAAGSALPSVAAGGWNRVMQWSALAGFALLLGGRYFSELPYSIYAHSDFWLNSPGLVACKLGVTLLAASGAYLWTEYFSSGWSWVRQLGTTSLVVYWVHIELTYGRWLLRFRDRLTAWEGTAAAIAMVALMVGVSVVVKRTPWRALWNAAWARPDLAPSEVPALGRGRQAAEKASAG
jgi:uncharacterized membrane protein